MEIVVTRHYLLDAICSLHKFTRMKSIINATSKDKSLSKRLAPMRKGLHRTGLALVPGTPSRLPPHPRARRPE